MELDTALRDITVSQLISSNNLSVTALPLVPSKYNLKLLKNNSTISVKLKILKKLPQNSRVENVMKKF